MNIFDENFDSFINNRIDETINSLKKSDKNYKIKLKEYNKLYHELYKELTVTQTQKLDKLLNISNNMSSDELVLTYKTATYDFVNLKNKNFFNDK